MPGPDPAVVKQRLFFALWPEPALADSLFELAGELAATCGGRVMPKDSLHMTLAFLGDVPEARLPAVLESGAALTMPSFEFELDKLGWWKHNRIVWAGVKNPPASFVELANGLRTALDNRGLMPGAPAFSPHVTLLRNARNAPSGIKLPGLRWRVAEAVLAASRISSAGAHYTRHAVWPLGQ